MSSLDSKQTTGYYIHDVDETISSIILIQFSAGTRTKYYLCRRALCSTKVRKVRHRKQILASDFRRPSDYRQVRHRSGPTGRYDGGDGGGRVPVSPQLSPSPAPCKNNCSVLVIMALKHSCRADR
ncbi:hypothetical protein CANTEDRAFT_115519 [Yamadazyma tenuis ATCC 10573]|uniref:Uncharacterized protein n=1 Tax=Candida tenuis (strain ATCC 10573 / BCRC 21748 / CBS 615 / JCM 9827 / NBRC 10315 / NRRL Y-1498 / VKM Y-70) TaxID=590646 RepID=G3BAI0_CANTC|nr:uncharacterized protein CANTEDRAFT_115519 [Yamadazyma tenuis ATCC 10573]EGV62067.1 hypothetical protein CANTEDRAFT_115519 [Yamadazyma tenuis ATCC 10573]